MTKKQEELTIAINELRNLTQVSHLRTVGALTRIRNLSGESDRAVLAANREYIAGSLRLSSDAVAKQSEVVVRLMDDVLRGEDRRGQ